MIDPLLLGGVALALPIGALIGWIIGSRRGLADYTRLVAERAELAARGEERAGRLVMLESEMAVLRASLAASAEGFAAVEAALQAERRASAEKLAAIEEARQALAHQFQALASQALETNNQSFLTLARETMAQFQTTAQGDMAQRTQAIDALVKPVAQSLAKVEQQIQDLERRREGAYQGLREQTGMVAQMMGQLRSETNALTRALRAPAARGRWGEIQLRRVAEMAGMLAHCDFAEQVGAHDGEARHRPDLVVQLPGGKRIVVDAKAPLDAFLDAAASDDDRVKLAKLAEHAKRVRAHIQQLSQKAYWEKVAASPEFVVLFLPGEHFFSAALEQDPALIEAGVEHNVLIATPTTLIALLRAAAHSWREESLAQNARQIAEAGRELHKRLGTLSGHLGRLGGGLAQALRSYNETVASYETRVLVQARRFETLEAAASGVTLDPIETIIAEPRLPAGYDPALERPLLTPVEAPAARSGRDG